MLSRVLHHFVLPRASLAAARISAALQGKVATRVLGANMEPTIAQGAIVQYRPLGSTESLVRGSLVAFTVSEFGGHAVPSRVVAVAGDSVAIEGGKLFVNGERVSEPYVKVGFATAEYSTTLAAQSVPQGSYFLLGDYRDASKDSRHIGPVPRSAILGLLLAAGEA